MKAVLRAMNHLMGSMEIPYEFESWTGRHTYPYWVGEYYGDTEMDESGFSRHAPILSGFSRAEEYTELADDAERIRRKLFFGHSAVFDGTRVTIFVQDIRSVPQQDDLRRIDITLRVLAWEGAEND
jgi:hypothetical protein